MAMKMALKGITEDCNWQGTWSGIEAGVLASLLKFKTIWLSSTLELYVHCKVHDEVLFVCTI